MSLCVIDQMDAIIFTINEDQGWGVETKDPWTESNQVGPRGSNFQVPNSNLEGVFYGQFGCLKAAALTATNQPVLFFRKIYR